MANEAVRQALGWLLGGIFIYSGIVKLLHPAVFAEILRAYRLLPEFAVYPAAILIPGWELGAGIALLAPGWRRPGAVIVMGLCALFLAAMGSAKARGLDIACGCFGAADAQISLGHFLLDAGLMAAAAVCLICPPHYRLANPQDYSIS